jgi:hypothetical protein
MPSSPAKVLVRISARASVATSSGKKAEYRTMKLSKLSDLKEKGFITEGQYEHILAFESGKIISVFYELRVLLYLGVMLFATGAGILIYENIGDIGHLVSMGVMAALSIYCFIYAFRYGQPFSNGPVKTPTPYFDYILLLGSLLLISLLTYLQVLFNVFDQGLGAVTLVTAAMFFYCAYRFDHLGLLSLAISALASFFSISVSPQKWYSGDFFEKGNLHNTAIVFGLIVSIAAYVLDKKSVKKHFTFTYMNFSALIFLAGALAGMFNEDRTSGLYLVVLYFGCAAAVYFAHIRKSFLFLLYAFVFGYIGTTYFLSDLILDDAGIWFVYLLLSCGGFIFFIVRYRNYFKRAA